MGHRGASESPPPPPRTREPPPALGTRTCRAVVVVNATLSVVPLVFFGHDRSSILTVRFVTVQRPMVLHTVEAAVATRLKTLIVAI